MRSFAETGVTLETGSGGVNMGLLERPKTSPCSTFFYLP